MKTNALTSKNCKTFAHVVLLIFMLCPTQIHAQVKIWDKRFGGSSSDIMSSVVSTPDGGYILGGQSFSGIEGDKTQDSRGLGDYWIVKTNASGNIIFDKRFGGNQNEVFSSIISTNDGGFLLGGFSDSGMNGDKSQPSRGVRDYWVVKIDASGNKLWDKRFGGPSWNDFSCMVASPDGGYLLGGSSFSGSGGDKTQDSRGGQDYWVVKIDALGNYLWDKRFGGSNDDLLRSISLTPEGGFLLGGHSSSGISGDKTQASRGMEDFWLVKIDASGNKVWDKRFGGIDLDMLSAVVPTPDNGYILGGASFSGIGGDKTQASRGSLDYLLIKIDASGTKLWDKSYGGTESDVLGGMEPTPDNCFILGGHSSSGISGDKTEDSRGSSDYWVVKIDAAGTKIWDKRFGGSSSETLRCMSKVSPSTGHIVLGGVSLSGISGDKTQDWRGENDYWAVKMTTMPLMLTIPDFIIACNPICPFTDFDIRSRYFTDIASFNVRVRVPRGKAAFNKSGHSYNQSLQSPVTFKVENDSTMLVTWKNTKNVSLPNDASLFKTSVKILDNSKSFKVCIIDAKAFNEKGVQVDVSSLCGNISFKNTPNKEAFSKTKEIQTQFNIYPNPGTDFFSLSLPQSGVYQIEISNSQGKILRKLTSKNQENDTTQTLDLQGFPAGLYLIKINDGKQSFITKIIKQ